MALGIYAEFMLRGQLFALHFFSFAISLTLFSARFDYSQSAHSIQMQIKLISNQFRLYTHTPCVYQTALFDFFCSVYLRSYSFFCCCRYCHTLFLYRRWSHNARINKNDKTNELSAFYKHNETPEQKGEEEEDQQQQQKRACDACHCCD